MINRMQFMQELQDKPWLVERLHRIVNGEAGRGASDQRRLIQLESIFNRAIARGHTLEQVTKPYQRGVKNGGGGYHDPVVYSDDNKPKTQQEANAFNEKILRPVLQGSDEGTKVLGFAPTGNASEGTTNFASTNIAKGDYSRYKQHAGEYYVQHRWDNIGRLDLARDVPRPPGSIPTASMASAPPDGGMTLAAYTPEPAQSPVARTMSAPAPAPRAAAMPQPRPAPAPAAPAPARAGPPQRTSAPAPAAAPSGGGPMGGLGNFLRGLLGGQPFDPYSTATAPRAGGRPAAPAPARAPQPRPQQQAAPVPTPRPRPAEAPQRPAGPGSADMMFAPPDAHTLNTAPSFGLGPIQPAPELAGNLAGPPDYRPPQAMAAPGAQVPTFLDPLTGASGFQQGDKTAQAFAQPHAQAPLPFWASQPLALSPFAGAGPQEGGFPFQPVDPPGGPLVLQQQQKPPPMQQQMAAPPPVAQMQPGAAPGVPFVGLSPFAPPPDQEWWNMGGQQLSLSPFWGGPA